MNIPIANIIAGPPLLHVLGNRLFNLFNTLTNALLEINVALPVLCNLCCCGNSKILPVEGNDFTEALIQLSRLLSA